MILESLVVGRLRTNCYVIGCERTREGFIVDPGDDAEVILDALASLGLSIRLIILTHSHFDHLLAAPDVKAAVGPPLAVHEREAEWLVNPPLMLRDLALSAPYNLRADRTLRGGETLKAGTLTLEVLDTPGHSPGGISLWAPDEAAVFSGDALFREGIGRTDLPGGDEAALLEAIRERLLILPEETIVYPGHGPATTIGHEKRNNPWLKRAWR